MMLKLIESRVKIMNQPNSKKRRIHRTSSVGVIRYYLEKQIQIWLLFFIDSHDSKCCPLIQAHKIPNDADYVPYVRDSLEIKLSDESPYI